MKVLFYIAAFTLLCGCAQMFPPRGGPKDTTPPQLIEEKCIPKNKTVNFNSQTILLTFDEFIKLNNPAEQIIISPAMEEKPEYVLKGKKLFIKLKSNPKDHTTYTINFGNAVADITENNAAAGLTYVFSTDHIIDSLQSSGTVTNAYTNAPEKNVWVLLHRNLSDTSFQKNLPDYLAKTDDNGNYTLQNLSPGEYKIYALKDGNTDYKYSQPGEEIAFLNGPVTVKDKNDPVNLKLFNESSEKQYVKSSKFIWPGKMQMVMNKSYSFWQAQILPYDTIASTKTVSVYKNAAGDTVDVWLRYPAAENGTEIRVVMLLDHDSLNRKYDTVTFRVSGVKETIPAMRLKSNASENFGLYDKLKLKYDRPSAIWKKEKMHLYKNDSVEIPVETSILGYGSSLINKWEEKTAYKLILEDSAFADVFYHHYSKTDTIKFTTVKKEVYGNILANISASDTCFMAELADAGGRLIFSGKIPPDGKINFENLKPGTYKIRVIADENNNGKWDTGNLKEKKQPERIWYYKEPVVVRNNWDFEITWKIEN